LKTSENLVGFLLLVFTLLLVVIYSAVNSGDLKSVALVWAFWLGSVFLIALTDDEHLRWLLGSPKKSSPPASA
jgi:hypothetical protein